jgi:CheY-like chemotaxis protein
MVKVSQERLRNILFAIFLVLLVGVMVPVEFYDLLDSALVLYCISLSILLTCTLLWALWWYISIKRPTFIFKVVGLLFIGFDYNLIMQIYARWHFVYRHEKYLEIIQDSNWWSYRELPLILIFGSILCWIWSKLFGVSEPIGGKVDIDKGKVRILVAEDDVVLSNLLCEYMRSYGFYLTDQAFCYEAAVRLFEPGKYVCAFIDLNLGRDTSEGTNLATLYRKNDPNIFLSVISGYLKHGMDEDLLGVIDDFIQKPIEIEYFRLKLLLWSVKYARRIDSMGSDAVVEKKIAQLLRERITKLFKGKTGEKDADVSK